MVDFEVLDQRIYALEEKLSPEDSRAKADELKTKAFGLVSNILFGAKKEDIEVRYVEHRYEPFWHVVCSTHIEYDRRRQFEINVDCAVKKVTIDSVDHDITDKLRLDGVEHCIEDMRKEVFVDATDGKTCNYSKHLTFEKKEIHQTEELMAADTIVVPATLKTSQIARNLLSEMLKPVKADNILTEQIRVEKLHLYFRPLYAFEYSWKTKNRTTTLELDAVTLETKPGGKALKQKMAEAIKEDDLFDIGAEVANIIVPGGGLVLKIARRVAKQKS